MGRSTGLVAPPSSKTAVAFSPRRGRCPTGGAVISGAGRLKAKYVIHAVGPLYGENDGRDAELAAAHRQSMQLAADAGCVSIAFPAISAGVYGYPLNKAAPVALQTVAEMPGAASSIRLARFVLFDQRALDAFETAAKQSLK
jgi:O-acetyl-ADP-ribose deacetylase